jgi:hypothetical protein
MVKNYSSGYVTLISTAPNIVDLIGTGAGAPSGWGVAGYNGGGAGAYYNGLSVGNKAGFPGGGGGGGSYAGRGANGLVIVEW